MDKVAIIVEDEYVVADNLRLITQRAGYAVAGIAESVEDAKRLIAIHKPGMVLLDINLKGALTGIDLAIKLNEMAIPFIYISAYCTQSILEEANKTHPHGFLVKPFRAKDVKVALDIAAYRHNNSLESALHRDQILIRSLAEIAAGSGEPAVKLRNVTMALQSQIPFDYLMMTKIDERTGIVDGVSFLREGLEDYKAIGISELLKLTDIAAGTRTRMQQNSSDNEIQWCNGENFIGMCDRDRIHKALADTFGLESNLSVPVNLGKGVRCVFSFYSRNARTYSASHAASTTRLSDVLAIASSFISLSHENQPAQERVTVFNFEGIVGNDPALIRVLDQVKQVAPFDTSVLLLGETGTGKERVATSIHQLSGRSSKPFVKVNCAALPREIIESELFGHEKGAFTGAVEKRVGKFEQADGGSIFLDEIGELPLEVQSKLLRVLQEKEIERLGGKMTKSIDVRIIAATNRNLEKEVADGRFRLDLFYRLNVFPLVLPPLRERKSDIEQLAFYFAAKICKKHKKMFQGISPDMITALAGYNWPGNIRELENVIEQSVVLNNGKTMLELDKVLSHEFISTKRDRRPGDLRSLDEIKTFQREAERDYIIAVLKKAGGRIRGEDGAAQMLNLPPTTLESKIARLGIKKDDNS